jgi:hypothetical protein
LQLHDGFGTLWAVGRTFVAAVVTGQLAGVMRTCCLWVHLVVHGLCLVRGGAASAWWHVYVQASACLCLQLKPKQQALLDWHSHCISCGWAGRGRQHGHGVLSAK